MGFGPKSVIFCYITLGLGGEKFMISATQCHQFAMASLLNQASVLDHKDLVRYGSAGQTVRNKDRCFIVAQSVELIEYLLDRKSVV